MAPTLTSLSYRVAFAALVALAAFAGCDRRGSVATAPATAPVAATNTTPGVDHPRAPQTAGVREEDESGGDSSDEPAPPAAATDVSGDTLKFADIKAGATPVYRKIRIDGMPPLKLEKSYWGDENPDTFFFIEEFVPRLKKVVGRDFAKAELFNRSASKTAWAFVYHPDRTVSFVEISGDDNLHAWFVAAADSFDGASVHRLSARSFSGSRFRDWAALAESPNSLVVKHAPDSYKSEELSAEKTAYFGFEQVKPNSAYDSARFDAAFRVFMKKRGAKPSSAAPTQIQALEQSLGVPLPGDFAALYERTGGVDALFFDHDLMSAEDVTHQWREWGKIYDGWNLSDLKSQKSAPAGVHPVYTTPRWVPFIDMVGGNYLAVDLGPAAGGTYGQVILFGADVNENRRIAMSVTELLEKAASYDGSEGHELYNVFGRLRF